MSTGEETSNGIKINASNQPETMSATENSESVITQPISSAIMPEILNNKLDNSKVSLHSNPSVTKSFETIETSNESENIFEKDNLIGSFHPETSINNLTSQKPENVEPTIESNNKENDRHVNDIATSDKLDESKIPNKPNIENETILVKNNSISSTQIVSNNLVAFKPLNVLEVSNQILEESAAVKSNSNSENVESLKMTEVDTQPENGLNTNYIYSTNVQQSVSSMPSEMKLVSKSNENVEAETILEKDNLHSSPQTVTNNSIAVPSFIQTLEESTADAIKSSSKMENIELLGTTESNVNSKSTALDLTTNIQEQSLAASKPSEKASVQITQQTTTIKPKTGSKTITLIMGSGGKTIIRNGDNNGDFTGNLIGNSKGTFKGRH